LGVMEGLGFLGVDVEALLRDPAWNPGGRELPIEERKKVATLLENYRYFARTSAVERSELVESEVKRMREAGAYIEYPVGEPPPRFRGLDITVVEPSDRPGYKRMFVFFEDDYPELLRRVRVERQQALKILVEMYELINGPLEVGK